MAGRHAISIRSAVHDMIRAEAKKAGHRECCGLLLGTGASTIDSARPCENVAEEPDTRFEIDPAALLAAHKAARTGGPIILGHYHSHPNGRAEPSPCDAEMAGEDGQIWAIVAHDEITFWITEPNGPLHDRFAPLTCALT